MKKLITSLVALLIATATFAVPARPGWQTKTQPDGTTIEVRQTGDEFYHYWEDINGNIVNIDANHFWRVVEAKPSAETIAARRQASSMLRSRPNRAIGDMNFAPRGLVILVNFKDSKFNNTNTASAMNDLMNSSNYTYNGATGSVRQYFSDQSDGQYTPEFDVIGPVTLPDYMSHYGGNDYEGNDKLPGDMVVEACSIANANYGVDFTLYDNDNDGYVDFVYLIYAGKGEADGGAANTIWPHNWDLESAAYYENCSYPKSSWIFDGKTINNYACSAELDGVSGKRAGIGTITHEFSHVIGLPDLYDTTYGQNYEKYRTPDTWHVMDGGAYNNGGKTPPNYSIYDKYFLGWKTPINPGATAQKLSLNAAGTAGYEGYQIATSNSLVSATSTSTVYYIENRQQSGWDAYAPGHGLLIWKVTYNNSAWADNGPNDQDGTLRYTIVSATGQTDGVGTGADPFPGTQRKTEWRGVSGKPLLNITETNGVINLTYIDIVDEDEPENPDTPDNPEDPTTGTTITGLKEADAVYVADAEYGDYWAFDLFAGYDYAAGEYIYPEVYVMVNEAYGKNTINGTYNIFYTEYFPNASSEGIYTDEYAEDFVGTLTIKHTDNNGNYSFKGTFVAADGQTYTFDQVVKVTAYEYLEDSDGAYYKELTLSENGTPDEPDEPENPDTQTEGIVFIPADFTATTSTAFELQKSNVSILCSSGTVNAEQFRFFKNQTVTISASEAIITSIEFTCTTQNEAKYGPGCFTVDKGSYDYAGKVGTWTGNAATVTFTASANQVRSTQIVVTVAKDTTPTGVDNLIPSTQEVHKVLHDGQILILKNGKTYTILGQIID